MNSKTIPFGKHQGKALTELQTRYLLWLSSQRFVAVKHPALLDELIQAISERLGSGRLKSDLLAPATHGG